MEPLIRLTTQLHALNETLSKARYLYLSLEAERKHFESRLVKEAQGKSHSEKVTIAQSSKEWLEFHHKLARLESEYQFHLFKFKITELEFQACYLTQKQDGDIIRKPQE